jgi:hypothetical protein
MTGLLLLNRLADSGMLAEDGQSVAAYTYVRVGSEDFIWMLR